MPGGNFSVQDAAVPVKEKFLCAPRKEGFHQAHCSSAAHQGVKQANVPPLPPNAVYRDGAAAPQGADHLCGCDIFQGAKGLLLKRTDDDFREIRDLMEGALPVDLNQLLRMRVKCIK